MWEAASSKVTISLSGKTYYRSLESKGMKTFLLRTAEEVKKDCIAFWWTNSEAGISMFFSVKMVGGGGVCWSKHEDKAPLELGHPTTKSFIALSSASQIHIQCFYSRDRIDAIC
jgi:hypothetical protein